MLSKTQVLQSIEELPEEFSANELIDQIILLQKIAQAQQEIQEGKGITTAQVEKELEEWLQ